MNPNRLGPAKSGKTSPARILTKAVNCIGSELKPGNPCSICQAQAEGLLMALIEIEAQRQRWVESLRDWRAQLDFRPSEGPLKVYIIDEVHRLSTSAWGTPPGIFVLATTEPF